MNICQYVYQILTLFLICGIINCTNITNFTMKRMDNMSNLELKNINKVYSNGVQAVFDFNLDIKDKDFIVLVGPSGCGKSTTLRMIAGLEEITSGELYIDGELMNDVEPKDRGIAMVFQSYALYPHLSVYNNIAFGLKLRKVPKDEIRARVNEVAEVLGLTEYLDRKPKALSGGQRQRVALGRAIIRKAKVFLMDEPLSNLDAKLRVQMRAEIIKLHERLQSTTVYVTHDQIEAMTMATRIVVMKDGYVQQIGTPIEVYNYPINMFVAGFIGTPPMNFINGTISPDGYFVANDKVTKLKLTEDKLAIAKENNLFEKPIVLGIRPEHITDSKEFLENHPEWTLDVKVDISELLGASTNLSAYVSGQRITAALSPRADLSIGDDVAIAFNMNCCHLFDADTQLSYTYKEQK